MSSHAKSILLAFIDAMDGRGSDYDAFRQCCLQFIDTATGGNATPMQLGAVVRQENRNVSGEEVESYVNPPVNSLVEILDEILVEISSKF